MCFGKFTKGGRFMLQVTCLDYIAKYAEKKVWVKATGEQNFLYGNHVLKAHMAKITEGCERNQGVVVCTLSDMPIGFGILGRAPEEFKLMDPTAIVVINQADVGEYLRLEGDDKE